MTRTGTGSDLSGCASMGLSYPREVTPFSTEIASNRWKNARSARAPLHLAAGASLHTR